MHVSVAYSSVSGEQSWVDLEVAVGTSALAAIEASGLLERFPDIDLSKQKIGVFGKLVKPDQPLAEYDRVEIYRPITADPAQVPRRKIEEEDC
ncbi:RnfH family protein [Nitrincola alkalisediminis]|uniref:RnfH family protein n=1 Tax=Nitrincola alkalisediminis TaxID=1366656 RepID=UPI0018745812|nr:RnfH family protein [Nitrincola alkalisediminis]